MKRSLSIAVLSLCSIVYAGLAWAHHSISADFNEGEYITIKVLTKDFRFINPHPYVTGDRLDPGHEGEQWTLLLDDRWELVEAGFSRTTFQPGDELVVGGQPSIREPNSIYVRSIERPADGWLYMEDAGEDVDDD